MYKLRYGFFDKGDEMKRERGDKKMGQLVWDTLFPWMIGLVILALIILFYLALSGKLSNLAEFIKNSLRFGK